MNTSQLRYTVRDKWLAYYESNREWIARMGIWMDYEGQRRPSSSFILAAVSVLEPQLNQMFPFIVELSSNPDRIVKALGLNFDPEQQLQARQRTPRVAPAAEPTAPLAAKTGVQEATPAAAKALEGDRTVKMLTPSTPPAALRELNRRDETCSGRQRP